MLRARTAYAASLPPFPEMMNAVRGTAHAIALALAADLVDEGDIGIAAALRLPHKVWVAALLGTKQVDVEHILRCSCEL